MNAKALCWICTSVVCNFICLYPSASVSRNLSQNSVDSQVDACSHGQDLVEGLGHYGRWHNGVTWPPVVQPASVIFRVHLLIQEETQWVSEENVVLRECKSYGGKYLPEVHEVQRVSVLQRQRLHFHLTEQNISSHIFVQLPHVWLVQNVTLSKCREKQEAEHSCDVSHLKLLLQHNLNLRYQHKTEPLTINYLILHSQHVTWPKVNSGVEILYRATLEVAEPSSICGEQHHLLAQVRAEQLGQVTHIVVVTGEITAIFILNLPNKGIPGGRCYFLIELNPVMIHNAQQQTQAGRNQTRTPYSPAQWW